MNNQLIKNKFRFELPRSDFDEFLDQVQDVSFPSVTMRSAHVIKSPKLSQTNIAGTGTYFEDLMITFILDEGLESYLNMYKWLITAQNPLGPTPIDSNVPTVGLLHIQDSTNEHIILTFRFIGIYPKTLSGLEWTTKETGDTSTSTCTVTFGYTYFELLDSNGNVVKPIGL